MPVPKAPVNKDDSFAVSKDNIWLAGKVFRMQSIPETKFVDKSPDQHLWTSALCLDAPHAFTSLLPRKRVHLSNLSHGHTERTRGEHKSRRRSDGGAPPKVQARRNEIWMLTKNRS